MLKSPRLIMVKVKQYENIVHVEKYQIFILKVDKFILWLSV